MEPYSLEIALIQATINLLLTTCVSATTPSLSVPRVRTTLSLTSPSPSPCTTVSTPTTALQNSVPIQNSCCGTKQLRNGRTPLIHVRYDALSMTRNYARFRSMFAT
eukprot:PhF_6_TR38643/c0_g1_i1/m.57691